MPDVIPNLKDTRHLGTVRQQNQNLADQCACRHYKHTWMASTSCLMSSPTLKIQAILAGTVSASCPAAAPAAGTSTSKATKIGTCSSTTVVCDSYTELEGSIWHRHSKQPYKVQHAQQLLLELVLRQQRQPESAPAAEQESIRASLP